MYQIRPAFFVDMKFILGLRQQRQGFHLTYTKHTISSHAFISVICLIVKSWPLIGQKEQQWYITMFLLNLVYFSNPFFYDNISSTPHDFREVK